MAVFDFGGTDFNLTTKTTNGVTETVKFEDGGVKFTFSTTTPANNTIATFPNGFQAQMRTGTNQFTLAIANPASVFSNSFSISLNAIFSSQNNAIRSGTGNAQIVIGPITGTYNSAANLAGQIGSNSIKFATSNGSVGSFRISSLQTTISCFCRDTMIETAHGPRAVQDLKRGDVLLTAKGKATKLRWLGRQTIETPLSRPEKVNPIRITQGALGDGLPLKDLYVSGDHAIEVGGFLVNASALVNGTTITQVAQMAGESFTYYHVETDAHELILAEGVGAETYLDVLNGAVFDNASARPDAVAVTEMDMRRVTSARLLPQPVIDRIYAKEVA